MPGGFFFLLLHETYSFGEQWNNRFLSKSLPVELSGEISAPPLPSIFLLSPSVVGVRIRRQTEPAVAFPGPRCQYVAASGWLAGAGQWCWLRCQAAAALGGRPASLRMWSQPRARIIIKSAEGGELSATAGSCAGSRPWVFVVLAAASRVTSPSCAVSVSGALRHGAPWKRNTNH